MADIWLPGYTRVDLGWRGSPYDETAHPKLLWHTTEGSSVAGARAAFSKYPPHGCYDPRTDQAEQYIPLNYHSWSLLGSEADDEYVIQWEIVGFASQSHAWPDWVLQRLGLRVAAPIAAAVGVPAQHLRFYRANEGIVLATKSSPIRLSLAAFRNYAGHLGHQHAPSPDAHWDPGGLPIDRILAYSQEDDMGHVDSVSETVLQQIAQRTADRTLWQDSDPDPDQEVPVWTAINGIRDQVDAIKSVVDSLAALVAELKDRPPTDMDEATLATVLAPALAPFIQAGATPAQVEDAVRRVFASAGQAGGTQ